MRASISQKMLRPFFCRLRRFIGVYAHRVVLGLHLRFLAPLDKLRAIDGNLIKENYRDRETDLAKRIRH